jgi:hypothetical protein
MNRLGGTTLRVVMVVVAAVVVGGGLVLALLPTGLSTNAGTMAAVGRTYLVPAASNNSILNAGVEQAYAVASTTTVSYPQTTVIKDTSGSSAPAASNPNQLKSNPAGNGTMIEFSSNISLESPSPEGAASSVVALAYSVGGYVAYQSTLVDSANVVIRVPAASYQSTIAQIEKMGNVQSLTSNSNDVTVEYTDLNATLKSLAAEQAALLRLVNQSTSISATLAIESQLQEVDQQINVVQSQMLQTTRLVDYSTISVSISKSVQAKPLSVVLTATPKSGQSPLAVTLNAVVTGGSGQYLVNYNFGDGTSAQGQILVHTFVGSGNYNVTVTATDQNGTVASKWVNIHVTAAPSQLGFGDFPGSVAGLFVRVTEGIVEVAAVVVPVALVAGAVLVPIRRWSRGQKTNKQSR